MLRGHRDADEPGEPGGERAGMPSSSGVERLRALAAASLAVTAAATLDERLGIITERARGIIGAHLGVTSLTSGPDWLQTVKATSHSGQFRGDAVVPDDARPGAEVCRTNRPFRLTQAELEALPTWRAGGRPPLRGWLAAPFVASSGRNLGLIQLSGKVEGEFTVEDEAILVQLAQLAAAGIENAQLYEAERSERERAQRVAERLGRLQEVTGAVTAATTPEQVAEAA